VVGRFLEHSRIYWFLNGGAEELYIGSADLMERNLDRRVETLTPVRDAEIREHLREIVLQAYLRDTERAFVLDSAGQYERASATDDGFSAQQFLLTHYSERRNE
jgi:polyphosphate kinase